MFSQHLVEPLPFRFRAGAPKPEIDNAGMWSALADDQISEISVVREDHSLLAQGDVEDLGVGNTASPATRALPYSSAARTSSTVRSG